MRLERSTAHSRAETTDSSASSGDLASRLGRQLEVAPHLLRKIRHDLQKGEFDVAWQYWLELREQAPELEIPPELKVRLAEAILEAGGPRSEIAGLLASARAGIGASPPIGILVRMARTSARAEIPGAASLCSRIAEDERAPAKSRAFRS